MLQQSAILNFEYWIILIGSIIIMYDYGMKMGIFPLTTLFERKIKASHNTFIELKRQLTPNYIVEPVLNISSTAIKSECDNEIFRWVICAYRGKYRKGCTLNKNMKFTPFACRSVV